MTTDQSDHSEDYQGGRDFNTLKKFAEENLGPSFGTLNCSNGSKCHIRVSEHVLNKKFFEIF